MYFGKSLEGAQLQWAHAGLYSFHWNVNVFYVAICTKRVVASPFWVGRVGFIIKVFESTPLHVTRWRHHDVIIVVNRKGLKIMLRTVLGLW